MFSELYEYLFKFCGLWLMFAYFLSINVWLLLSLVSVSMQTREVFAGCLFL